MEREDIERKFCCKISSELKMFKYRKLELGKDEIYASAYQIDCMIRIYEMLLEKSKKNGEYTIAEMYGDFQSFSIYL